MSQTDEDAWPNENLSSFVDAAGLRWHIQRSGSGPNILLVHGFAASTHSWRELIPMLARHYSVLAVDLPGHGRTSAIPSVLCSISGIGNMLTILLENLNFQPAFVVDIRLARSSFAIWHSATKSIRASLSASTGHSCRCSASAARLFHAWASVSPRARCCIEFSPRRAFNRRNVARVLESTGSRVSEKDIDLYAKLLQQPAHVMSALSLMSKWDLGSFMRS